MTLLFIPKDIWILLVDIESLYSFCSLCKHTYNQREWLSKHIFSSMMDKYKVNKDKFIPYLEGKFTYYQFIVLLTSKTYFHKLSDLIIHSDLKSLIIKNNLFNIECYENTIERKVNDDITLVFFPFHPKVTLYYTTINLHEYQIINSFEETCCNISYPKGSQNKGLMYVRSMVLYEKTADVLLPIIKGGIPIFPPCLLIYQVDAINNLYKEFFDLIFNNDTISELFFNILKDSNTTPFLKKQSLLFLYYLNYNADKDSLAYRKLNIHKPSISKVHFCSVEDSHKYFITKIQKISLHNYFAFKDTNKRFL